MKKLLLFACMGMSLAATAQNSLLKNPVKGALPAKTMNKLVVVANNNDAVIVVGDTAGMFAIDAGPNSASTLSENVITSVPDFVNSKLKPAAGQDVWVADMAVNPVNRAVYVLAFNSTATVRFLFRVEKAGSKVTLIDLANVTYSKLAWGGKIQPYDVAYNNNTLYVSSGSFSLNGEIGWMTPPFTHNAAFTKRGTSFFKSNNGGVYSTTAPLETIAVGKIAGKDRMMGVTTCAPGFSFELSKLPGTGVLKVSEDFNMNGGYCKKAVFMQHDNKDWLFALYNSKVYRLGKKYLDGSQVTANKYDANSDELMEMSGTIKVGAEELKLMSTTEYAAIAYWDHSRLLVIDGGFSGTGTLSMMQVSTATPPPAGIAAITTLPLKVYPNPAKNDITLDLPDNMPAAIATMVSMSGSVVLSKKVSTGNSTIDIRHIPSGIYTINVQTADGVAMTGKITVD